METSARVIHGSRHSLQPRNEITANSQRKPHLSDNSTSIERALRVTVSLYNLTLYKDLRSDSEGDWGEKVEGWRLKVKEENTLQTGLLDNDSAYLYYDSEMGVLLVFYARRMEASSFIGILDVFQRSDRIIPISSGLWRIRFPIPRSRLRWFPVSPTAAVQRFSSPGRPCGG